MTVVLQVALGGAIGAVLRYLTAQQVMRLTGAGWPLGTLAVNVIGCFVMGLALGVLGSRSSLSPILMTGILGGFTTFSAFSADTILLLEDGRTAASISYVVATVGGTLAALVAGLTLGRAL